MSNSKKTKRHDANIPRKDSTEALFVKSFPFFLVDYRFIHRHPEFEICYCPHNTGKFFINDKEYEISAGDIFIINGNEYHQPTYDTAENQGAVVVYFNPSFISPYHLKLSWMKIFLHASNHSLNRVGNNPEIAKLILSLLAAFQSKKPNWSELCWGILSHILVLIEDHIISASDTTLDFSNNDNHTRFNKVIQYIKENLAHPIALEDLYAQSSLSKSQFSLQFKKIFKCTATQYISQERCNRAAALLKGSDKNISEIAYLCGFNSLSYFNKQFKLFHHNSPREFRERY